jgi:hypothetical protein
MNTRFLIISALFAVLLTAGCEKGPGPGGTSAITGKVTVREYNRDFTNLRDIYPGWREDVYIVYGDDEVYGDDFETDYNGNYEFKYLREGKYTIYVYSKDSTLNYDITSLEIPIIREVEITAKDQTIEVPEIVILK